MPIDESKRKTWHCPHCEKVFKTPQAMKEHVVVKHEGTATQKCDECQRSFGTYSKLRDHKKLVHERVKCQECGQEICNYFMLKRHRATVHGIKPKNAHQCEYCPMFFSFRASLHKHVQSKHQANNVWGMFGSFGITLTEQLKSPHMGMLRWTQSALTSDRTTNKQCLD